MQYSVYSLKQGLGSLRKDVQGQWCLLDADQATKNHRTPQDQVDGLATAPHQKRKAAHLVTTRLRMANSKREIEHRHV